MTYKEIPLTSAPIFTGGILLLADGVGDRVGGGGAGGGEID